MKTYKEFLAEAEPKLFWHSELFDLAITLMDEKPNDLDFEAVDSLIGMMDKSEYKSHTGKLKVLNTKFRIAINDRTAVAVQKELHRIFGP